MSSLDFAWNGYRCFSSGDHPEEWQFVPLAADLQRHADGRLATTLQSIDDTTYAMFAAVWGASAADLDMLRTRIEALQRGIKTNQLRLRFAPVLQPSCNILVGDGTGSYEIAATSDTSGYPPFTALFNLAWRGGQALKLKAGFAGMPGYLGIEYLASLARPASTSARLKTTAEAILAHRSDTDGPDASLVDCVKRAIRTGEATFTAETQVDLEDAQAQALLQRCAEKCSALVAMWLSHRAGGTIAVETEINEIIEEPVRAFCDVGTLIDANHQ